MHFVALQKKVPVNTFRESPLYEKSMVPHNFLPANGKLPMYIRR